MGQVLRKFRTPFSSLLVFIGFSLQLIYLGIPKQERFGGTKIIKVKDQKKLGKGTKIAVNGINNYMVVKIIYILCLKTKHKLFFFSFNYEFYHNFSHLTQLICFSYMLLHSKLCPNLVLKTSSFIISQFLWSGIQAVSLDLLAHEAA